jgi:chromosome segregation ATPase
MSTRLPGTAGVGVNSYRQEDERRRDEARASTLQNQVDELRQALRELASRQVRIEEGLKQYEGAAAQNRLGLEQFRQEAAQTAQARALDENRTRQIIADLDQRIDDTVRPIRSLQAHVNELLELSRKKTDDTGQHQRRYDELRSMIDHLQAQSDRGSVVAHQLRDSVESVRGETDQIRRDMLRNEDATKIVDQESRRRDAEVTQTVEAFTGRLDELRSDLGHQGTLIEETQRSIAHIDPSFDELRAADAAMKQEIAKNQAAAIERHEALMERDDDQRQSMDAQFAELRNALDQRYERITERIDAVNEQYRELGYRISALAMQLDELRQADASLRRDLWTLNEQRVRLRLEQAQHELDQVTGSRRAAEQELETPRPTQRSLDT